MSIYMEIVNEFDISPHEIKRICDGMIAAQPAPWNLPVYDILDVWGDLNLRQAFALLTGGDTPTTYSRRMADALKLLTDPKPTLLGFDDEPISADFTRTQQILADLREPVDAEIVDE